MSSTKFNPILVMTRELPSRSIAGLNVKLKVFEFNSLKYWLNPHSGSNLYTQEAIFLLGRHEQTIPCLIFQRQCTCSAARNCPRRAARFRPRQTER